MRHPRILIAAPSSGSGKTTAVCVLLTLLKRRGLDVKACKCGPDYIDPMFHTSVLDIPCTNLDPFFCDRQLITHLLSENAGADITVIEGVMGYYDGTGEDGTDNSTFTVASATSSPVILVVNARGAAASLLAVIEGFLDFMPASGIKGILF
ncbi:MAG: cobyrinic acid a,c-diamide synthase, partial [Lachnospiraceae bacterium]|nr:cobyrinic acid a,c-diamide synthase [Lachnospiraceae bacterium]